MREILFRGKHRDTGEWLYFGLFDTDMHYGDGFIARYKNGVEIALANINEYYEVVGNVHDERPVEGKDNG